MSPIQAWMPHRPLGWAFGFAALFALLHGLTDALLPLLDVVSDQISLIYLPAFVRVISVVVAGLAGVLGIAMGSFVVNLLIAEMPPLQALAVAVASASGILAAYWALREVLQQPDIPIRLSMLIALTGLYCTFNAILHGLIWSFFGMARAISVDDLALMMLGDLLGVAVMYGFVRGGIRWMRQS